MATQRGGTSQRSVGFGLHLRQDAGNGKTLSYQVRQIAVHEDEEGLDRTDVVGETCGERGREAKQKAKEDASNSHHKEPGNPQKHISGFDDGHVGQEGKHVVKNLWREKETEGDVYMCWMKGFHAWMLENRRSHTVVVQQVQPLELPEESALFKLLLLKLLIFVGQGEYHAPTCLAILAFPFLLETAAEDQCQDGLSQTCLSGETQPKRRQVYYG